MERINVITNSMEEKRIYDHIFDNAQGTIKVLDEAPTEAGDLPDNSWGYYSNTLYLNINGSLFSLALTAI